jgi:1-acyl-sn-glycerol-3-phosphate acyltransferase
MAFLRTALFYLLAGSMVAVLTIPVMISGLLPYRFRWPIALFWARCSLWFCKQICGLDYEVRGREHLPNGPAIAYCKHQSAWETVAMIALCPAHTWVLKREIMWVPFLGWALMAMRPVAIDRGSGRRAVLQVQSQGKQALEDGRWMMIFPEGTRLPPYTTRRYGISGALLGSDTGHPIVPIAHNAGHFWPRKGLIKPGKVTVVIGEPIETAGKTPERINAEASGWMEACMAEIEPPRPTP